MTDLAGRVQVNHEMHEMHEMGIASRRYKPASGCLPLGHGRVTGVRSDKSGLCIVFVCFVHLVVCAAASFGSACTSQNYTASHVLTAMGLPEDQGSSKDQASSSREGPRPNSPGPAVRSIPTGCINVAILRV